MSFRRIPKEIDPRRPPKQRRSREGDASAEPRSYGQYVDATPDEIAELERATGEVAREGASESATEAGASDRLERRALEAREAFEEATDEVSREDE